jgi:hypothetical protein
MAATSGSFIKLNVEEFVKDLRKVTKQQILPLLAKGINRTAFEVRLAESLDVSSAFKFAANTEKFLTTFRFDKATSKKLYATILPKGSTEETVGKTESILLDHQQRTRISLTSGAKRLGLRKRLAIPTPSLDRNTRGKVPAAMKPSRIIRRERKRIRAKSKSRRKITYPVVQLSGGRLGVVATDKGKNSILAYVVQRTAPLEKRLNFHGVALAVARHEFPIKMREEFNKLKGLPPKRINK